MLAKLNHYRQNLSFPFIGQKKSAMQYRFEWADNLKQLQEIQRFRAKLFAEQFGINFEQDLDQDLYDLNCEHAVLRDKHSGEIVAYTRLKLFQEHNLQQSYSAQEFDLSALSHLERVVEIGRTCVHPRYRNGRALSVLWLNLVPTVLWQMRAKHLIGCVSVRLEDNLARAYYTDLYLKNMSPERVIDVPSRAYFEPQHPEFSFPQDERIPKLFQVYLAMNAKLSREAYHDVSFNCLDYFVLLDMHQVAEKFVRQKLLQR
ncbi:GNAT family N-acetyltransferase [Acinetobacter larvae]|uniref:L-ornithine N(alpha)-acyltransferase n=1 Tax=Acinetobacter larvae TaxID=1789224 RepID=A0A1B2M1R3_9GAMM|nr:GNAT family N-acetyltransferase [Acinetobacter larvae]AOA59091.1 GNAT family N-acetyltransferase [Acinetobacter larvae]